MPGLVNPDDEVAKIVYLGDQGHGKTGSKAALIAAGYKLRMINTDRGSRILRSLLTDPRFPYAAYMKKRGINPLEPGRISQIPIDIPIDIKSISITRDGRKKDYNILAPTSSEAWPKVINLLREWKDGDLNLGPITSWGPDEVLDFDTLSTLAQIAFYWNQDLNNRLGALEDDHGRDTGAAQELIRRLMQKLTSPSVKCNVIITTHITYADITRGAPQSPEQLLREHRPVDPRGFPSVIGRALSPVLGKGWNDMFIVRRTGNSASAERRIYTVPTDNTDAKASVFLEPSYPISTGLAEIFAALQYKESPTDLIKEIRGREEPKPGSGFGR